MKGEFSGPFSMINHGAQSSLRYFSKHYHQFLPLKPLKKLLNDRQQDVESRQILTTYLGKVEYAASLSHEFALGDND